MTIALAIGEAASAHGMSMDRDTSSCEIADFPGIPALRLGIADFACPAATGLIWGPATAFAHDVFARAAARLRIIILAFLERSA